MHVWVRLGDDFLLAGVPSFNVVGSRVMLIKTVPLNWRKVLFDQRGSEVVDQLVNSRDVGNIFLHGKPSCSDIDAIICMNTFISIWILVFTG